MKRAGKAKQNVAILPIARAEANFDIVGLTPLIQNKFSAAAKKKMLDKQMGKSGPKELRKIEPEAEAKGHTHLCSDGSIGFPADAFSCGIVEAAPAENITKKLAGTITVMPDDGDLVKIKYRQRVVKEDTVRLASGVPDIVHRPYLYDWSCKVKVMFDENRVSAEKLASLINRAGFDIGVGAWRPYVKNGQGKPGWHGRYALKENGNGRKKK